MNKISARNIHLLVAGVIALDGFNSLYWALYYCVYTTNTMEIVAHLLGALALALGIGIFMGSARAVRLTLIYFWINIVGIFTGVPEYCYYYPSKARGAIWNNMNDMLVSIFVLVCIYWSRSRRFRTPNPALE